MDDRPLSSFHETICTTLCHLHLNKEQTVGKKTFLFCYFHMPDQTFHNNIYFSCVIFKYCVAGGIKGRRPQINEIL